MIFQLGYAKQRTPWSFEAVVVDIRTPRRAAKTFRLSSSGRMSFNTLVFGLATSSASRRYETAARSASALGQFHFLI